MLSFVCDVISIEADKKNRTFLGFLDRRKMSDDLDSIPVKHQRPAIKVRISFDFSKCVICQKKHKKKAISQATSKSIMSIADAAVLRKDNVRRLLSEEFKEEKN